jgi:hypothetical protein
LIEDVSPAADGEFFCHGCFLAQNAATGRCILFVALSYEGSRQAAFTNSASAIHRSCT